MLRVALIRFFYLILMFLAGLVLANLVLPERFGSMSLLIINASLFSLVTGLGSDSIVIYKVSTEQWNILHAFQFAWRTILFQIVLFLAFEFGSWFLVHKTFFSSEGFAYLFVEITYFLGLVITEKYIALYYSLHKTKQANIILTVVGLIYFLLLILFYSLRKIEVIYLFDLFALQSLVQAIVLILFFRINAVGQVPLDHKEFLKVVKLSSVVMITNVIQLFVYRVDFWVLKYYFSNYEVGLYAQANKFANLCWVVPNVLAQLLLPKFASMDKCRVKEIFSVGFYFNIFIVLTTVVCTQFFYFFYLRPEYKTGLPAFYLMLPGYFFWGSVIFFGAFVSSTGKFFYNFIASTSCFILIVFADLILIPRFGITGAAIANSICYSSIFFLYVYVLSKKFSFRWNGFIWPRKKYWLDVFKYVRQ